MISGGSGPDNLNLAADFLELTAFFSPDKYALTQSIVDALELTRDGGFHSVDDEITRREEAASGATLVAADRKRALNGAYPFEIWKDGRVVSCDIQTLSYGRAAYLISLVLSNLRAVTPLLDGSGRHPTSSDVSSLRQYFQFFATAALAAEIGGQAWSFGFPRPDHSGFLPKLREIWDVFWDGRVGPEDGETPQAPKDDGIDVFAGKIHPDGLPGFLFAAAQVATGANWKEKSLRSHLDNVFFQRRFERQPVTPALPYHIVPFALAEKGFRDHVNVLGNVLHRLRLPLRVEQAGKLHEQGIQIEAYDQLDGALEWLAEFASRGPDP